MEFIKAIETEYKGYKFRSRLEARWAVFMDAFCWNWQYEYEGLDLGGLGYLPDFILHDVNIVDHKHPCHSELKTDVIIEVKGTVDQNSIQKAKALQNQGKYVLVVGDIPDGRNDSEILENLRHLAGHFNGPYILYSPKTFCNGTPYEKRECEEYLKNDPYNQISEYRAQKSAADYQRLITTGVCPRSPSDHPGECLWVGRRGEPIIGVWHTHRDRDDGDPIMTLEAYKQARQARFEHGQSGYNY